MHGFFSKDVRVHPSIVDFTYAGSFTTKLYGIYMSFENHSIL
jgi:hypothetical protein